MFGTYRKVWKTRFVLIRIDIYECCTENAFQQPSMSGMAQLALPVSQMKKTTNAERCKLYREYVYICENNELS